MQSLEGKHVVIVGGGAALAQPLMARLLDHGNRVSAIYRHTRPTRPEVHVAPEPSEVLSLPIDSLVTLCGSVNNGKIDVMSDSNWKSVIENNLTAVFDAFWYLLRKMVDGGSVVVVGSIVGSTGGHGCANYAAAKAGLVGLVRAAANENPHLRINLLELGYVNAGMGARLSQEVKDRAIKAIPMRRFAEPEEAVDAIEFLMRQTYMTGGVLTFAGGLR